MNRKKERLESIVMKIHFRNGGGPVDMDWTSRLLSGALILDSLDLAEVVVRVEKEFGVKPFDGERPPRTWMELLEVVEGLKQETS